jgi:hypothetical protein
MYKHEIEHCKKVIANGAKGEILKGAQMRLKEAEAGMKAAQAKKSTGTKTAAKKKTVKKK